MSGLVAPATIVKAPVVVPAAHELLDTAIEVVEAPVRRGGVEVEEWTGGFYFQPEQCEDGGTWVPCITEKEADLNPENESTGDTGSGSGETTQVKSEYVGREWPLFIPYMVEASFTCSTFGWEMAEYAARAERLLSQVEGFRMAQELWTGEQMRSHPTGIDNVSLVGSVTADGILNPGWSAGDPTSITAVSARVGMSLLAEALADCGRGARGVIHIPPYLADLIAGAHVLEREGSRLTTRARGDWIISDAGYPRRAGPLVVSESGAEIPTAGENEAWMFGTGMVNYRRGKIRRVPDDRDMGRAIGQAMLPASDGEAHGSDNKVTFRAERFAAAVFDPCCAVAVLVDLTDGIC